MNKFQKVLTGVVFLVFVVTLFNASWDVTTNSGLPNAVVRHWETTAPIWDSPGGTFNTATLQVGTLIVEWMALGVVYIALLFFLKTKKG